LLREAASTVHRISSSLRDRSVDALLHDFGEFARRRPATLIGASLIGGFALARFLKSSADRRALGALSTSGAARPESPSDSSPDRPIAQPSRGTATNPPGFGEPSETSPSNAASPAADMGSITNVTPGTTAKPGGTSSTGEGAEAPDQGVI
jgi:hypothetical protein